MKGLAVEGVGLRRGNALLLDDVTFAARPGMLLGLIGPNGAGKSTLLRVLAGLVRADRGLVSCDGRPLAGMGAALRGRCIAYLPQAPELADGMSVREAVALGRLPHGGRTTGPQDSCAINAALDAMDLAPLAGRAIGGLSGGERARVALGRAFAVEAPVLLADEPAAALDPARALDMLSVLRARAAAGGVVIAALHDLLLAQRFCTHLAVLHAGRLVAFGLPGDVLTDDLLRAVYGMTVRRVAGCAVPWDSIAPGAAC